MKASVASPVAPASTRWPCSAKRLASQAGSALRSITSAATLTPAPSSAPNHAAFCCCQSSLGRCTSRRLSGPASLASCCSASLPSLPGLPDGMRISISCWSANRPMDCDAPNTPLQSK